MTDYTELLKRLEGIHWSNYALAAKPAAIAIRELQELYKGCCAAEDTHIHTIKSLQEQVKELDNVIKGMSKWAVDAAQEIMQFKTERDESREQVKELEAKLDSLTGD